MNYLVARAKFMITLDPDFGGTSVIEDAYILTKGDKIHSLGKYRKKIGDEILKTYKGKLKILGANTSDVKEIPLIQGIILPAFVKAHGHDHESPIIGLAKDVPLTTWLDEAVNVFSGFLREKKDELERALKKPPHLVTYLKARLDDIYYGIATSLVHHCNHNKYFYDYLIEAAKIAKTKMVIAIGSQDRFYEKRILDTPEKAISRLNHAYKLVENEPFIKVIPGPDQLFSNSPKLLKTLKQWALDRGTLIHIHSSEEPKTTEWFTKKFGKTPIEYAHSIDFLDPLTILAHQVNCTDKDLKIIQQTGAKVVHNPLANTILGSGMPPIIKMLELGIPIAISTDGSGSANNQNIINSARLASQYQKALNKNPSLLPANQLLEMITKIPAQFLGFDTGQLSPGKLADFIIFDITKPNMVPTHSKNCLQNIFWASNGDEIKYLISNGVILKENYKITVINEEEIKNDILELTERFLYYKERFGGVSGTGVHF